ncbi:TPA: host cell division inhibitor Icd-like protein [Klebsiella pneumoniae]
MPPVEVKHKWQRPGVLGTTTEASNHNVIGANTMAELQHTQTRPEFTWLFLATPEHLPHSTPVVLRICADTEETARAAFHGWNMVFAAKIRSQMRCSMTFYNNATCSSLTVEIDAAEGVNHA